MALWTLSGRFGFNFSAPSWTLMYCSRRAPAVFLSSCLLPSSPCRLTERDRDEKWGWKIYGISWNPARRLSLFPTFSKCTKQSKSSISWSSRVRKRLFFFFFCCRNKRVCVDLSYWLIQLQNVTKNPALKKDKIYLRNLFHRLRALIALNCSLIFVTGMWGFTFSSFALCLSVSYLFNVEIVLVLFSLVKTANVFCFLSRNWWMHT